MSLFDDLKKAAEEGIKKAGADVSVYLASQVSDPFVKIAQNLGGNLTTQQIEAGKTPSAPAIAAPSNAQQSGGISVFGGAVPPIMLMLAVGVGAFLIFRRK